MMRNLFIVVLLGAVAWTSYLAFSSHQIPDTRHEHPTPIPLGDEARNATNVLGQLMHIASNAVAQPSRSAGYSRVAPPAIYRGAIHYSPVENLEAIDSATILNSRCDHLDIAMYSFTDFILAKAVVDYANRGHRVRVYRDKDQFSQEESRNNFVAQQFAGNRNIEVRVKGSRTLMHIKGYSDGCVLREGSANWSPSGEKQQDNTLTLSSDVNAIRGFEADFELMWNRPNNRIIQ
jgi:hypothetical protein